jgi:hypothetical protein
MPWVRKLVWEQPEWEREDLPLSRRIDAAFRAGKRGIAYRLNEEYIRQRKAVGDPFYEHMDDFGHITNGPIETTRPADAAKPVDPFVDYLRSAQGGKK